MKVLSLLIGKVSEIRAGESGEWWDKEWRTGFLKNSVEGAQWLGYQGFRGDEQGDTRYHGGVDKAVCVYPAEHYPYWHEVPELVGVPFGSFGENLTTEGLIEGDVCIGDVLSIGDALVQVSQPRQPCWKLARRWKLKDLAVQVERTGRTGFYLRVLRHGLVTAGDFFSLMERPFPDWSVEKCNEVMHRRKSDRDVARALSECAALSASWKDSLRARSEVGAADSSSRLGLK